MTSYPATHSALMFGPNAWTDIATQSFEDFERYAPFAAGHAERLNDRMLAVCRLKVSDGVTKGKFFLGRGVIKYVCNFYRLSDYVKRTAFESDHPWLHEHFGQCMRRIELASGVLTWRHCDMRDIPDFDFVTLLFEGGDYDEKRLILTPQAGESVFADFY